MAYDTWFCMECAQVRDLDSHARCASCGSDSLTPASLVKPPLRTEEPGSGITWERGRRVERDRHGMPRERSFV
jgi:hypothetical protein